MSTLYNATTNMGFTENGALTLTTTGSAVLDLFAMGGALRSRKDEAIISMVDKAYQEDAIKTLAVLLYLRDCRGGQGEKRLFKVALKHLVKTYNLNTKALFDSVAEVGCYKDIFDILSPEEVASVISPYVKDSPDDSHNLLFKWMPSIKGAREKYAKKLARLLGMSDKEYRKFLSAKRKNLNLVESKMCRNEWKEITYSSVPSRANLIYSSAFMKHDAERYGSYLADVKSGKTKINASVLYPYEVYTKKNSPNADALWEALPDYTDGTNALVVCDTSGSMLGGVNSVSPISVAVSLALYFAERNKGIFHNEFITFSDTPKFQKIEGNSLLDRIRSMINSDWGMSTNLQKVFKLILNSAVKFNVPKEEMPVSIYIISDMEFNSCVKGTNLDEIIDRYKEAGYDLPRIIFWNVDSRQNNVSASKDTKGVMLVSGCSPSVFACAVDSTMTPETFMDSVIEKYKEQAKNLIEVNG